MNQHPAYELFEELGRGVNTVVYRSYDLSLGREVAVKELDETARRDPRHRERFLREAQFLAQFEHDNVLRVYSVDTDRGWIIMELMKGTLASVIAAGPSEPDLVRSVLKQTLEALAFLHEKNKVHGTVRPTNLLINEAGRVKLSEFEHSDAGGELRAPKGSKKYLAPELIRPEFGDFGPPLDLYCLGFTALELLKGPQFESLFPGTGKGAIDADVAWLRWHSSTDELASVQKLVKGIPDDLAHVLDRMLKKRVANRPQSAQEVLKELADRPLVAVPLASVSDDEGPAADGERPLAPGIVRTISAPPTAMSRGSSPAAAAASSASTAHAKPKAKSGRTAAAGKPAAPRFSKDWFNQQLGRPYILYPLCALILLGALWFSISLNSEDTPVAAAPILVTFDVQPDAAGLQIVGDKGTVAPAKNGQYAFDPGHYALTFRKEGFQPLTKEFDVSAESNKFAVKLEPIVKLNDIVIQVTPADAKLNVGGSSQSLVGGTYTHKLQQGQPIVVEASRDGFVTVSRTITPEELTKLENKVTIELARNKPRLPAALVEKPGAQLDSETQLPVRVLAATFAKDEPMELVLVKPGTYSYGSSDEQGLDDELPKRSVRIEQPFYIAINETTNAQYQRYFDEVGEAKAGNRWQRASGKWAGPLKLDPLKNHLPVTNVSSQQAQAFCTWLAGRLPTEIEWESAVRGPQDRGYPFPWGTGEPNPERCQIFYGGELGDGFGPVQVEQLAGGASPLGLMHAIGNAAEWCQDSEQPGSFIVRGCSFATANIDHVRVTSRTRNDPQGGEDVGFRVVIPISESGFTAASPAMKPVSNHSPADLPKAVRVMSSLPWQSLLPVFGPVR